MRMLRSIAFNVAWVINLAIHMIVNIPFFLTVMTLDQRREVPKRWARSNYWLHRVIVGTKMEVQGEENIPHGPAIIASKHQSNWDFYVINDLVPNSAFILKEELMRIPIFGRFVTGLNHIPIRRADKGKAMRRMIAHAKKEVVKDRQIIIFAEGTRTLPTAELAYRYGTTRMYLELGVPVVPVALNSGLYWERKSRMRHPGTIRIRFMKPIPPGLDEKEFAKRMTLAIEQGMDAINAEALTDEYVPPLAKDVAKLPPAAERLADS